MSDFDANWTELARVAQRCADRVLRDFDASLDVSQDTMALLYLRLTVAEPDDVTAWVCAVASNLAKNEVRRRDRARKRESRSAERDEDGRDPSEAVLARILVEDLLRDLPLQQRRVLWLRFAEELDRATVGRLLEIATETVKTHAQRGLENTRARLRVIGADFEDDR